MTPNSEGANLLLPDLNGRSLIEQLLDAVDPGDVSALRKD